MIGEQIEQATNLGRLLHTLGHAPCLATEARAIPFHGTSHAVYRLLGTLHDLQAEAGRPS